MQSRMTLLTGEQGGRPAGLRACGPDKLETRASSTACRSLGAYAQSAM